jgi:hypothetical protein
LGVRLKDSLVALFANNLDLIIMSTDAGSAKMELNNLFENNDLGVARMILAPPRRIGNSTTSFLGKIKINVPQAALINKRKLRCGAE